MKCPVCEKTINDNSVSCYYCGFDKMRSEFINESERNAWYNDTVIPCRKIYEKMKADYDELDHEYDELEREYEELDGKYTELKDEYDDLEYEYNELEEKVEELEKSSHIVDNSALKIKKKGWNYDDLIAHPNYAKCSYVNDSSVVEIYNIEGEGTPENYKIKFVVKMLSRKQGCNRIHFNWRLKDSDGVVALTGHWIKDGLLPGDVIRGEIGFNNVGEHIYTIDFIDV